MKTQTLNGIWKYRIGHGTWSTREVPFSARPVGHSECERTFDLEYTGELIFLQFDGITYHAKVTLNGKSIGEMLPYCEYRFDVTDTVLEKGNVLTVEIEDIAPTFGPTAGWENFGGIIRGVSLVYAPKKHIEDVFFHCVLTNGYMAAEYTVEVKTTAENAEYTVELSFNGEPVDTYTSTETVTRTLESVHLWSPDSPLLYELTVRSGADEYHCHVGFREIKCDRHRFILNGEPLFLVGVCNHELIGDLGHTATPDKIEADLRMIKDLGCNFVRLVHYPHCKETLELADRLGLMVSEEPGLWWSNTADPAVAAGSIEVLRRTILRDRNHPCIAFWLCFNECEFTEQFLIDSARVCRENDPYRLVSGANCMSDEDTLKYYNLCGFDFYTMHPYAPTFERSAKSAAVLHDKPLVFTEWGGYHVCDNPHLLTDFIEKMYALYKQNSDDGALAGAFLWHFSEIMDLNRGRPACIDGVLREGLVTFDRKPTLIFDAFREAWATAKKAVSCEDIYYYESTDTAVGTAFVCENTENDYARLLCDAHLKEPFRLMRMRPRKLTVGPLLQSPASGLYAEPRILFDGGELTFTGDAISDSITLIGAVSVKQGYPISGEYGEIAAVVYVETETGRTEKFELRNGIDITTVFTTIASSRIDPIAENAKRFALFGYDKNHENYIINRLDLPLFESARVNKVRICWLGIGYDLLFYGVFGVQR